MHCCRRVLVSASLVQASDMQDLTRSRSRLLSQQLDHLVDDSALLVLVPLCRLVAATLSVGLASNSSGALLEDTLLLGKWGHTLVGTGTRLCCVISCGTGTGRSTSFVDGLSRLTHTQSSLCSGPVQPSQSSPRCGSWGPVCATRQSVGALVPSTAGFLTHGLLPNQRAFHQSSCSLAASRQSQPSYWSHTSREL